MLSLRAVTTSALATSGVQLLVNGVQASVPPAPADNFRRVERTSVPLATLAKSAGKMALPPKPPKVFNLTKASLARWVNEQGLDSLERANRLTLQARILSASKAAHRLAPLVVNGNFSVKDLLALKSLPAGLRINGDLDAGSMNLESLGEHITVTGDVNLSSATKLRKVPSWLQVGGNLYLGDSGVESLGDHIEVKKTFYLNRCYSLRQLPPGFTAVGNLNLSQTGIRFLEDNLEIAGDLELKFCQYIRALPNGLKVGGSLHISFSVIESIGENIIVKKNAFFSYCDYLRHLPQKITVGWHLSLTKSSIPSFPSYILNWGPVIHEDGRIEERTIYLENMPLPDTAIEQLLIDVNEARAAFRQTNGDGPWMRFIVSQMAVQDGEFKYLGEALIFWQNAAGENLETLLRDFSYLDEFQRTDLRIFLSRLKDTAEYKHAPQELAKKVLQILREIKSSPEMYLAIIHAGLSSCNDRVIRVLNELYLLNKIEQAKDNPEELLNLAKQCLHLEIIHEHARAKVKSLAFIDELEVYLAYETSMEAGFLPVCISEMNFRNLAQVTEEDVFFAKVAAFSASEDQDTFKQFLKTFEPWQIYARKRDYGKTAYQDIKKLQVSDNVTRDEYAEKECLITLSPWQELLEPVILISIANGTRSVQVYEFAAIKKLWLEKGKDALDQPFNLQDLRRLKDKMPYCVIC